MRNLTLALVAAIFASGSINSEARSLKRYTRTAEMEIVKADNDFAKAQQVSLAEYGFMRAPQGVEDLKQAKYVLSIDGKNIEFNVVDVQSQGRCNSIEIKLVNKTDPRAMVSHLIEVTLVDHTFRVCRDFRPYGWEASVVKRSLLHDGTISLLDLRGNPVHN